MSSVGHFSFQFAGLEECPEPFRDRLRHFLSPSERFSKSYTALPPWFTDDVVQKGVAYFQSQGFEVVHASHLTPAREVPHPNLGSDVNPAELYEWVRNHVPSNMECAFIAGNGFRAIGVIAAALEEDLGRPRTRWRSGTRYACAGVGAEVDDYGQLFRKKTNSKL
jgi:maleate cis-trans isomerase